jgi:hypothetical protein
LFSQLGGATKNNPTANGYISIMYIEGNGNSRNDYQIDVITIAKAGNGDLRKIRSQCFSKVAI